MIMYGEHSILKTPHIEYWVWNVWVNIEDIGHGAGNWSRLGIHMSDARLTLSAWCCSQLYQTSVGDGRCLWSIPQPKRYWCWSCFHLRWKSDTNSKKGRTQTDMRVRYGDPTLKACFEIDSINRCDHFDWSIAFDHIDIVTRSIATG